MRRALPDILSLARIPCAVVIIIFYSGKEAWRFEIAIAVLLFALATDFLDGALARKLGVTSRHGYIIDGLGDRAIYIALFLAFLVQQRLGLLVTWLLIFREVAIYAVRLFSTRWLEANKSVRLLSSLHAGLIRLWILSVLAGDAALLYARLDPLDIRWWSLSQAMLLIAALAVSYYSLLRHLWANLAVADP
jgi:phosphatidylglycerophosphate synthase